MNDARVKSNDLEALEALILGPSTGGRKRSPDGPVVISVVRSLTSADIPLLTNPPAQGTVAKSPLQLRHSHHQIARLLAAGRADQEIALITGYSPAYISSLKGGQDFKDLIGYYSEQKDQIFVDVMERMKALGLDTLDELQKKFNEEPDSFTTQQKMDLIELMLIKPIKAAAGNGFGSGTNVNVNGAGVTVNVQFVKSEPQSTLPAPTGPDMLDVTPKRERIA